jgi:hypothetical protein
MKKLILLVSAFVLCGSYTAAIAKETPSTYSIQQASAYEMMETVFIGKPRKSTIQPLIEAVMKRHGLTVTEQNLIGVSSALVSLRKESAVGVTEMDILKHMYQKGNSKNDMVTQMGTSAAILEYSK